MKNTKMVEKYTPMTETAFYILYTLQERLHGYGVMSKVKELTDNRIVLGSGTLYGTLAKMVKDGLVEYVLNESEDKKIYGITDLGKDVLDNERKRIEELYLLITGRES